MSHAYWRYYLLQGFSLYQEGFGISSQNSTGSLSDLAKWKKRMERRSPSKADPLKESNRAGLLWTATLVPSASWNKRNGLVCEIAKLCIYYYSRYIKNRTWIMYPIMNYNYRYVFKMDFKGIHSIWSQKWKLCLI